MKHFSLALVASLSVCAASAQCDCPPIADRPIEVISDAGQGTGTDTWTCQNTYILDGYVFVNAGQALTIEAGTVVKGASGSGVDAAAMIVSKGGQIFAEGSADCPIVFTFEGDALDGSVAYNTRGQWGGLIVLGDATTNFGTVAQVEGIPTDNNQAQYGGDNDEDNSGVLTYVSIRHGGTQLGAANEINGLTLAGVGSGTTIHHVEVVSNFDDGIEFFGGSVTVDHALVAFCGDDSFDWDQGFHGGGSNWLAIQDQPTGEGDRAGELDGDDSDDSSVSADEMPFAIPTVQGWTVVGVGDQQGLLFRNGTGGHVSDALICNTSEGIEIEDKADEVIDAYDHFLNGDLTLMDIVVTGGVDAIDYDGDLEDGDAVLDTYAADNNITGDTPDGLDSNFDFDANGAIAIDPLFLEVGMGSGQAWAYGWSFCDQRGMFATVAAVDNTPAAEVAASLFPNPSLDQATLALPTTQTFQVRIMTLAGAVAGTLNNVQGQVALPGDLTAGTYLVNVIGATTSQTLTWIKR